MAAFGFILFLGASIGHAAILIYALNYSYGTPTSRKLLGPWRDFLMLLGIAGLFLFVHIYSFDFTQVLPLGSEPSWRLCLSVYVVVAWVVAFIFLPIITVRRLMRHPAALLSNHTHTVDVGRELGYIPSGNGKHRRLARLPGNESFRVDFRVRELKLPQLPPAWNGLTILHLSDLHFCGTPDRRFYQHVMDLCRNHEPDILAVTGDFVDSASHHRWIVPVLGRLRWRCAAFAILGNHDSWFGSERLIRQRLRRLKIKVLDNTWRQTEIRGQPLVVIGNEMPWFRPEPNLTECPEGIFRLCLSHTPDNIRWATRHNIDLMLAGHNHGGQIRLPVIGSVLVPSRYGRHYDNGVFQEGPTIVHVSRGLGGTFPYRYNCRPDITQIILRAAGKSDH